MKTWNRIALLLAFAAAFLIPYLGATAEGASPAGAPAAPQMSAPATPQTNAPAASEDQEETIMDRGPSSPGMAPDTDDEGINEDNDYDEPDTAQPAGPDLGTPDDSDR
jgi:hypothetical protein